MSDFYDNLINNIFERLNSKMVSIDEDAVQPQQPAPAQPQQAPAPAPVQPAPQQNTAPQQVPAPQGEEQPAEDDGQTGESEIQEMAGQLAQLIRVYKKENPGQDIEVSKFAAGMVVAAAIKGLEYDDRKDIIKKLKAGDYDEDETEDDNETKQAEEVPQEEPQQQQPMQERCFRFSKAQLTEIFARLKEEDTVSKTIKTKNGNEQSDLNTAAQDVNSTNSTVTIVSDDSEDNDTNITPSVTASKANSSDAANALKKYGSINVTPNTENN